MTHDRYQTSHPSSRTSAITLCLRLSRRWGFSAAEHWRARKGALWRHEVIGICVNTLIDNPHAKTKPISEILDDNAVIDAELLGLAQWMQSYHHYPLGEVLATILPSAARKGSQLEVKPVPLPDIWHLVDPSLVSPRAKTQKPLSITCFMWTMRSPAMR